MTNGLVAYSDANNLGLYDLKETKIEIRKVENGYIFELQGNRELPPTKNRPFDNWERFSSTFVYETLETGLAEMETFFKMIEDKLKKRVEHRIKKKTKTRVKKHVKS